MNSNKQQGFTLIELVMVIVILGILAATALPKFADMSTNARIATLKGALGAVNAAASIAHSQALIDNVASTATGSILLEGTSVALAYGYPDTGGILSATNLSSEFDVATAGTIMLTSAPTKATCSIKYVAATSATVPPVITIDPSTC